MGLAQAAVLRGLAGAHIGVGNLVDAETSARQALAATEKADDPVERGLSEMLMGDVLEAQHKTDEVKPHWQRALDVFLDCDSPRAEQARERLGIAPDAI